MTKRFPLPRRRRAGRNPPLQPPAALRNVCSRRRRSREGGRPPPDERCVLGLRVKVAYVFSRVRGREGRRLGIAGCERRSRRRNDGGGINFRRLLAAAASVQLCFRTLFPYVRALFPYVFRFLLLCVTRENKSVLVQNCSDLI